jgi:predicted enzyme related to lactoylglutathione lyase
MERTKLGEITWTDLQAVDMEKQSPFYEALFGWTWEDMPTSEGRPDYRMFYKDGVVVAGGNRMSPDMQAAGMPSFWAVYAATPDIEATLAKAEEAGGTVIMPLMDVMTSGKMVAVADPTGGSLFFWQKVSFAGAGTFMEPGTIGWADLSTTDPEAAAKFYGDVFGWDIKKLEGMEYWQVEIDGVGEGGIGPIPEMLGPDARPFWTIYFMTDDIEASVAKAVELGGTITAPVTVIPDMLSFAVIADPAGANFSLLMPVM